MGWMAESVSSCGRPRPAGGGRTEAGPRELHGDSFSIDAIALIVQRLVAGWSSRT